MLLGPYDNLQVRRTSCRLARTAPIALPRGSVSRSARDRKTLIDHVLVLLTITAHMQGPRLRQSSQLARLYLRASLYIPQSLGTL